MVLKFSQEVETPILYTSELMIENCSGAKNSVATRCHRHEMEFIALSIFFPFQDVPAFGDPICDTADMICASMKARDALDDNCA